MTSGKSETQIAMMNVESIDLENTSGKIPTALIDACWDVTGVDVVDRNGQSVVNPERREVGWTRFTLTNSRWDADPTNGWRVSGGSDLEKAPCAGS